jgi:predicted DNA-binding protein
MEAANICVILNAMPRTEIELTEEQARRLDQLAARSGRSVADVIRDSVDVYLDNERALAKERARKASGRFRSGLPDLGMNHDKYLAEDFDD